VSVANQAVVRRFFEEVCTQGRADVAEEIIAPNFIAHDPLARSLTTKSQGTKPSARPQ
jgi:predicted SnoaL-like aldol condensation-catalyzing enzyme